MTLEFSLGKLYLELHPHYFECLGAQNSDLLISFYNSHPRGCNGVAKALDPSSPQLTEV